MALFQHHTAMIFLLNIAINLDPTTAVLREPQAQPVVDVSNHKNLNLLPMDICGPFLLTPRISAGTKAKLYELPWMASVLKYTNWSISRVCGGTIINNLYILTSAHCVTMFGANGARVGSRRCAEAETDERKCGPVQNFVVEKHILHPLYNVSIRDDAPYDVALLRLANPINFEYDNIRPICLPIGLARQTENIVGRRVRIAGWGDTEEGKLSDGLLRTTITVLDSDTCNSYTNYSYNVYENIQLCGSGDAGGACIGDSGAPIFYATVINGSVRFMQRGIYNYGSGLCSIEGDPGVYADVGYFMSWILDTIQP